MNALPSITSIPWPGIRFVVGFQGAPGGLSAAATELQDRRPGRWADLSIVEPVSRQALLAALGRPQPFELDIQLLDDEQGRSVQLHCLAHWVAQRREHVCQLVDLSDLRRAHEATDRRLHMLQEMVDGLPMLVIQLETGPDLRCAFAGGALLELVTPHSQNPVGRDAPGLLGPELFAQLQARLRDCPPGQTVPLTWRVRDPQDETRVLEGNLRSLVDAEGQPSGHLLDALETTAYHATMSQLQASEERLRRFATASSDGIIVHVDQWIIDANPAACHLLGTPAEALRQRRFEDLIAPEDRASYQALADRESHEAHECELIDGRGTRLAVELIGRTVQRQGKRMRMAIVRDLRDRREAQARIRELIVHLSAQKDRAETADRAKSLFLSAASHDLRQPIHALGLFLTSLEALLQSPFFQRTRCKN